MDRNRQSWPRWLEPLRPDELSRARMRLAIRASAAAILGSRRIRSWEDVAAGWASMLVPIAAVLLLFFGGLAYQTAPRTMVSSPVTLEELMPDEDPDGALGVLTTNVEPSRDWALTAVIGPDDGNRRAGSTER